MHSVEYLAIIEKTNTFCDSSENFNKLLQVDSSLSINGDKITFEGKYCYGYRLINGEILEKNQRFFHLYFTADKDSDVVEFSRFLRKIREILSEIKLRIHTLWDDVSFFYSKKSYDVIHRIENLMRKLIANFMLKKIGIQWVEETAPPEVKAAVAKSKRTESINILHNLDFIHLADFLLKPYTNATSDQIYKSIKNAKNVEDLVGLKELLPESNWNRYFSSLVKCEDTFLQKRWLELYDLRCRVAHNSIIAQSEHDRIVSLSGELEDKLINAINELPQVTVPVLEALEIAEKVTENTANIRAEFNEAWHSLRFAVNDLYKLHGFEDDNKRMIDKVVDLELLSVVSSDNAKIFYGVISKRTEFLRIKSKGVSNEVFDDQISLMQYLEGVVETAITDKNILG